MFVKHRWPWKEGRWLCYRIVILQGIWHDRRFCFTTPFLVAFFGCLHGINHSHSNISQTYWLPNSAKMSLKALTVKTPGEGRFVSNRVKRRHNTSSFLSSSRLARVTKSSFTVVFYILEISMLFWYLSL